MEFFSPRFLLFFPGVLLVLALIRGAGPRRLFLTLASCLFYASWDWRYLVLLLMISAIDYGAAALIAASDGRKRKLWLILSMATNLGILGYFKYANFFLETYNHTLGPSLGQQPLLGVVLPAGISFYTFKTMSYTIDVYRGRVEPCRNWLDYALFVSFFPDLIAGPIVRASSFLPQLRANPGPTSNRILVGANLFLQGLTKKMFVADRLGEQLAPVFERPEIFATSSAWLAVLAYGMQIYCDFSGYSDMAAGCAHMMGYHLPINFNLPYASLDVSEFWRRWHITLSSWLRDYLYIPLGGNRSGAWRTCGNLMLTMLLGGLWHGAAWNFVVWGGLHGLALCLHRAWRAAGAALPSALAWLLTTGFVLLAWVPFRCSGWSTARSFFARLLARGGAHGQYLDPHWTLICLLLLLFGHTLALSLERLRRWSGLAGAGLSIVDLPLAGSYLCFTRATFLSGFLVTLWLELFAFFACTAANPFLYFRF